MQAIKNMCREIGITRNETEIPLHKLDYHIRADLDTAAERVLAVLKPLKLVLTNLPEDYSHTVEAKVRVIYLYSFPFLYSLSFSRGDVRYSFLGKPSYALPYFLRPYAQHQAGSWKFLYRQKIFERFRWNTALPHMLCLPAAVSQQSRQRDVPGAVEQGGVHRGDRLQGGGPRQGSQGTRPARREEGEVLWHGPWQGVCAQVSLAAPPLPVRTGLCGLQAGPLRRFESAAVASLSCRLQPRAQHGVCRYAGLVKCTGFRKEEDKLVEVHGEFQPLKAGQKLPKVKLCHSDVLCVPVR